MKYTKETYESVDLFPIGEEDIENQKQKIVKTRKPHKCCICSSTIKENELALRESGFLDGQPVSCYYCLPCCDDWLDKSGIGEEEE